MKYLLSSASLALLAALCSGQATYRQDYGPGFAANVAADGTRQIIDTSTSQSFVVDPTGRFLYSNAGYAAAGGISANGRQALGTYDPSYFNGGLLRGVVRVGAGADYPLTLDGGEYAGAYSANTTRLDPYSGRVFFVALNSDATAFKYGIDAGDGEAREFRSDGVVGTLALDVQSISSTLLAGYGYGEDGLAVNFWNDGSAFHTFSFGEGLAVRQMALSVLPGSERYLSLILDDGQATYGAALRLNADGTATDTGLRVGGATGVAGDYAGLAAFWSDRWAVGLDLASGTRTTVANPDGSPLSGVTRAFVSQGNVLTLSGSFGSGQAYVAPVPEPASYAALGCGLAALLRRRRSA